MFMFVHVQRSSLLLAMSLFKCKCGSVKRFSRRTLRNAFGKKSEKVIKSEKERKKDRQTDRKKERQKRKRKREREKERERESERARASERASEEGREGGREGEREGGREGGTGREGDRTSCKLLLSC